MVTPDYVEVENITPLVKPSRKAPDNLLYSGTVKHITVAASDQTGAEIGKTVIFAKLFTHIDAEADTTRYFTHKNAIVSVE